MFHQEKKNGKVFQSAANNILGEESHSIQDYYKKHKKNVRELEGIDEENDDGEKEEQV